MPALCATSELVGELRSYLAGEPEALADPYPLFNALREHEPVVDLGSIVVVSRYEEVKAVLRDPVRLSSVTFVGDRASEMVAGMNDEERNAFESFAAFDRSAMQHSDGEQHARLRRIAHRAFTPARVAEQRAAVQQFTETLLEPLTAGVVDLKPFAYELPLMVIVDMLDASQSDRETIRAWSEDIGNSRGVTNGSLILAAHHAIEEFRSYVHALVDELRQSPRSGSLVGALIDAHEDERLATDELTTMFIVLLFAGHETTTNLISIGLKDLLQHRDQWDALCADPGGKSAAAVEELLRFSSPVQTINRVAVADLEIGGVSIKAGQAVIGLLGSANRDPSVFEHADQLDIDRPSNPHLDFGFGQHFCLGSALARLEGQVALTTLATRHPTMRLAAGPNELRWGGNAMLRKLAALPVSLETASD